MAAVEWHGRGWVTRRRLEGPTAGRCRLQGVQWDAVGAVDPGCRLPVVGVIPSILFLRMLVVRCFWVAFGASGKWEVVEVETAVVVAVVVVDRSQQTSANNSLDCLCVPCDFLAGDFRATATAGFGNQPQPQPQVRLFPAAVWSGCGLFRLVQPDLESLDMDDVARFRDAFVKHLSSRLSAPITAESQANADLRKPSAVSPKNRIRRRSDKQDSEHRALQVMSRALLNPIYLSWDIEDYADTTPAMRPQLFQHCELGHIDVPATIVDQSGIIVLWYLPNILPRRIQTFGLKDQLFDASSLLNDLLNASVKESRSSNWRVAEDSYRYPPLSEPTVMPGAVNFSSGWYGTGHSSKSSSLKPSLNLREFAAAEEWLREIAPAEIILNSILSITHPRLYDDASTALSKIRELPETQNIASCWPSVYTGISVIANRLTVPHTDRFSRACWYDSLASVGPFTAAYLEFPDIGLRLSYHPCTVVNLCGNILRHRMMEWEGASSFSLTPTPCHDTLYLIAVSPVALSFRNWAFHSVPSTVLLDHRPSAVVQCHSCACELSAHLTHIGYPSADLMPGAVPGSTTILPARYVFFLSESASSTACFIIQWYMRRASVTRHDFFAGVWRRLPVRDARRFRPMLRMTYARIYLPWLLLMNECLGIYLTLCPNSHSLAHLPRRKSPVMPLPAFNCVTPLGGGKKASSFAYKDLEMHVVNHVDSVGLLRYPITKGFVHTTMPVHELVLHLPITGIKTLARLHQIQCFLGIPFSCGKGYVVEERFTGI
ncbi:hypothetical protein FPV67DRAFT_1448676 [Lyophyllum atratum]|nr:hypothetical protein FPV67DRAFT_1448676 [Lyophyllum atratum]